MKKLISVSLAVLVLIFVCALAGCSQSGNADLKAVLSDINSKFSDSTSGLTTLEDVSELNKYYQINTDGVTQFAAEITSDTSKAPVEIVMVEAKDSDSAASVEEALEARYQTIYGQYASYSAEQFEMVKECGVTKKGNYVILIVAEDYDEILSAVNSAIG